MGFFITDVVALALCFVSCVCMEQKHNSDVIWEDECGFFLTSFCTFATCETRDKNTRKSIHHTRNPDFSPVFFTFFC